MTRVDQIEHLQHRLEAAICEVIKHDPEVKRLGAALRSIGQDYYLFVNPYPLDENPAQQLLLDDGGEQIRGITVEDQILLKGLHIKF